MEPTCSTPRHKSRHKSGRTARQNGAMPRFPLIFLAALSAVSCTANPPTPTHPVGPSSSVAAEQSAPLPTASSARPTARRSSSASAQSTPATPTPSTTTTPVSSPTPGWTPYGSPAPPEKTVLDGTTWLRLGAESLYNFDSFGAWPSRGHWLGSGSHTNCTSNCVSQDDSWLLESRDAISWSILGQLPPSPAAISDITETELGLFAVGTLDDADSGDHAGIWRSIDGATWTSLSDQQVFQPGQCLTGHPYDDRTEITLLYQTPSGLVATGTGTWFSTDGDHWTCAEHVPAEVEVVADEFVGFDFRTNGTTVWSSHDAVHWTQTGSINGSVSVETVRDGLVAVTQGDPRMGTYQPVYTSPDGKAWSDIGFPFKPAYVSTITSSGERAAAVDQSDPAIWLSSDDGHDWKSYALPTHRGDGFAGDELNQVEQLGNTVVVMASGAGNRSTAALFVAQIP
jgi:hypothetical protein